MVVLLRALVLNNFKSYSGTTRIDLLPRFTCVIGPNGAGKSNIVEAITFVLGVRTPRVERLQQLLHRKEGERPEDVRHEGYVELVCERYPDGAGETQQGMGDQVVFRRTIIPGTGNSRYDLNGRTVSQAEYMAQLQDINIIPRARNFVVFQGDISRATAKQGRELTQLFEQVSGSVEHKQEYERLVKERAEKEAVVKQLYQEKQAAVSFKRTLEVEKKKSDKYKKLEAEGHELKTQYCLFKLHQVRSNLDEQARALDEMQRSQDTAALEHQGRQRACKDAEREKAQAHLQTAAAARRLADAEARETSGGAEEAERRRVEASTRLEGLKKSIEDTRAETARHVQKRSKLEEQVKQKQEEAGSIAVDLEEAQRKAQTEEVKFTAKQKKDFDAAEEAAEQQDVESAAEVRDKDARLRAVTRSRGQAERELRELSTRRGHLRDAVAELEEKEKNGEATVLKLQMLKDERLRKIRVLTEKMEAEERERGDLEKEKEALSKDMEDMKASKSQVDRELEFQSITKDLKRLIPGTHGRVLNLCQSAADHLKVAVNVALGSHLDSVLTDTTSAARECIKSLKERGKPQITFVPLQTVKVASLDPQVAQLLREKHRLRPAMDCLKFDPKFRRAFEFFLNDVVIADTLEDGSRFLYDELRPKDLSCKIVTLQGETIGRSGNMAINCNAARQDTTRFDLTVLGVKKARLEAVERRLRDIEQTSKAAEVDQGRWKEEARKLEEALGSSDADFKGNRAKLEQRREYLAKTDQDVEAMEPNVLRLISEESDVRKELNKLEQSRNVAVRGFFTELNAAMGLQDVRGMVVEGRRQREEAGVRAKGLQHQKDLLEGELSCLQQTLKEEQQRDPSRAVQEKEDEIAKLQKQIQDARSSHDIVQEMLEALRKEVQSLKEAEEEKEKDWSRAMQEARESAKARQEVEQQKKGIESEYHVSLDTGLDLLRQSVTDNVDIPLHGEEASFEDRQAFADAVLQATPAEDQRVVELIGRVNFTRLPMKKRRLATPEAALAVAEEFRNQIAFIDGELLALDPSFGSGEQHATAVMEAQAATRNVADARQLMEEIDINLRTVRQTRHEKFMGCFQAVEEEIQIVYQQLTGGGSAYLNLENLEDPWDGSVQFTARPPSKAIRDLGELSGGEQTLAVISLLLAIQAYQRPPFLVFDEVDANLDNINKQALAQYFSAKSKDCQTIAVTLQDYFYKHCDHLVGVTQTRGDGLSKTFGLDLDRFADAPSADGRPVARPAPLADQEAQAGMEVDDVA